MLSLNQVDLSVKIAGINMQNPIMPASGCFDPMASARVVGFDLSKLGAMVSKGTTLLPRSGNPQPRIWETPKGMINSIGLENLGIEVVIKEIIPFMLQFGVPIFINVSGFKIEEYLIMTERLNKAKGISAIEVNISCPNIHGGGMLFGSDPDLAFKVVSALKKVSDLPLIVKLTPNVRDITEIAQAVENAGAASISLINTFKAAFIVENRKIHLGGLSGEGIFPITLRMVYEVAQKVKIPIIGMGGVSDFSQVLQLISVGAHGVAIGTANFKNPLIMMELIDELGKYCLENGIQNLSQLRGTVK